MQGRVEKFNEASTLDAAEKEKRKEAAKKIKTEAQEKKQQIQDLDKKPVASGEEEKR